MVFNPAPLSTAALGALPLTPRAPPHSSALTNATPSPLPEAIVAGQYERTRAGGPYPLGTGEATPGHPTQSGSSARGRVKSPPVALSATLSASSPSNVSQFPPKASPSAPLTPSPFSPSDSRNISSPKISVNSVNSDSSVVLISPSPTEAIESANRFFSTLAHSSTPASTPDALLPASSGSQPVLPSNPSLFTCLQPSDVEALVSEEARDGESALTTLSLDSSVVSEAVEQVVSLSESKYPGYRTPPNFALLALEMCRRQHGRLDVPSAVLRLRPAASPLSSSLGLATRLTLAPSALDALVTRRLPFLDSTHPDLREAVVLIVDAARVQYPRSVISAHTAYYAVEFSRTTHPTHSIDLNVAFGAIQPLSFVDSPPRDCDWDFASLNAAYAAEQNSQPARPPTTPPPSSPRRRVSPTPVPAWRGSSPTTPNQSRSTASLNPVFTPPLPRNSSPLPTPTRRVSFQDLGYQYRVGTKRPLDEQHLHSVGPSGSVLEQGADDNDYDDLGESDSEEEWDDDDEEGDENDEEDDRSFTSSTSHKRKSSKTNSNTETLVLIRKLIEKMRSSTSATLTKPPEFWYNGDAPKGGYFLETFTRLYSLYKNFVKITESNSVEKEECGLTFKNLITDDMETTIRSHLDLESESKWNAISNSDLIKALKSSLGFKDKDYYLSQLEEFQLPSALSASSKIYNTFVTQTSDMLKIVREAEQTDVHLRKPTLKNLFQQYIAKHYRLNQWFHERSFKSLSKSVRYITKQYKRQHIHDKRRVHESRQDARVNGVRSDFRGGKMEPADAEESRGEVRRKADNKRFHGGRGRGRGGDRFVDDRRARGDSVTSDSSGGTGTRGRGGSRGGVSKFNGRSEFKPNATPRPDLRSAYALEDSMPRGRFWHIKTPFCKDENCRCRVCQGCGFHSTTDDPGHDRPHCPNTQHPDFVAAPKYFHEVWVGRQTALVPPPRPARNNSVSSTTPRSNEGADS
jgi:hypothetical protein